MKPSIETCAAMLASYAHMKTALREQIEAVALLEDRLLGEARKHGLDALAVMQRAQVMRNAGAKGD